MRALGAVGLSGVVIFLAGLIVLAVSRRELLDWLAEFVRILRAEFARRGAASLPAEAATASAPSGGLAAAFRGRRSRGALRLLGGLALLLLGQVLVFLDLAF